MAEPYLSDPARLVARLLPEIPAGGTLALGSMNYKGGMAFGNAAEPITVAENDGMHHYLDALYGKDEPIRIWNLVSGADGMVAAADVDKLFLKKDSIDLLLKRCR